MKVSFKLINKISSPLRFVKWLKKSFGMTLKYTKMDVYDILRDTGYVEIDENNSKILENISSQKIDQIEKSFIDNGFDKEIVMSIGKMFLRENKLFRIMNGNERIKEAIKEAVYYEDWVVDYITDDLSKDEIKEKIIELIYQKYKI